MDGIIGNLLNQLEQNKLLKNMNIIILSDHGMANSKAAPILVTDYVDTNLIDMNRSIFNYVSNVYPKSMTQLSDLYDALTKVSNTSVYYKKDIPASYYFSKSDRIGII